MRTPATPPVGCARNKVLPRYSATARRRGVEGLVVVMFEVSEPGAVRNLQIVSGAPELVEMVVKWVPTWCFKPATRDGNAIAWRSKESIRFRLEDA